jgi:hypothetical protein
MPYSERDAEYFFGRAREQRVITANLMASRLTLLYGASGVGKSSVLRAGVSRGLQLLALQNISELGTPEYVGIGFSSWRDNPIRGLLDRVGESINAVGKETGFGRRVDAVDDESKDNPQSLAQSLQRLADAADATLLITLDQFEEYFLYVPQHTEEKSFAFELAQAINAPGLHANFLISIREDALAKLDSLRDQIPNLFDNYLRIDHLDYRSAREAIEKPINKYNTRHASEETFSIEPELVSNVLDQIQTGYPWLAGSGQGIITDKTKEPRIETPYLQVVMTRLWDQTVLSKSRVLQCKTLIELGGAKNIIHTHLDAAMDALSDEERNMAAQIFNYLVTPSGSKIAHTAQDLAAYSTRSVEEILPMLEKLASGDARVLRTVPPPPDKPNAEHLFEIFHDVLAAPVLAWRSQFEQKKKTAETEKIAAKNFERALDELNESERDIAANIFSNLILSSGVRTALTIEDLANFGGLPLDDVRKVVARLSGSDREILRAVDPISEPVCYQVSNEILVKPIAEWCDALRAKRRDELLDNATKEVSNIGRRAVIVVALYYILIILFASYGVYVFWPRAAPDPSIPDVPREISYLFWTFSVSIRNRLIAIAVLSGLLGSAIHGFRSFANYASERVFGRVNLVKYALIPFLGPLIGVLVMFVIQAGAVDKNLGAMTANPMGVAAVGFVSGLIGPSYLSQTLEKFLPDLRA